MATISTHNGSAAHRAHNLRVSSVVEKLDHVDPKRPHEIWVDHNLRELYQNLFGAAVEEYNAKQLRPDRKITDYYEQVKKSKRQHPVYEMICGVYQDDLTDSQCREILREFAEGWQKRNPNLTLAGVYYHADEMGKGPHIHIDYVPVAHGYKRGPKVQTSLTKALEEQGIHGENSRLTAQILWEAQENKALEKICQTHGLTVAHPQAGKGMQHMATEIYKAQQDLEKSVKQVETVKQEVDDLCTAIIPPDAVKEAQEAARRSLTGNKVQIPTDTFNRLIGAARASSVAKLQAEQMKQAQEAAQDALEQERRAKLALREENRDLKVRLQESNLQRDRYSEKFSENTITLIRLKKNDPKAHEAYLKAQKEVVGRKLSTEKSRRKKSQDIDF